MSQFCTVRVPVKDQWNTLQDFREYRLRKTELARLQKAAEIEGTTAEDILYRFGLLDGLKHAANQIKATL